MAVVVKGNAPASGTRRSLVKFGLSTVPGEVVLDDSSISDDGSTVAVTGALTVSGDLTVGGVIYTAEVDLSAADILALSVTPKTLVAAPGSGKVLVFESLVFSFTAATQYTSGGAIRVQYNGASTNVMHSTVPAASVQGASDFVTHFGLASTASGVVMTANKALEMINATGAFADGTGTAKVFIKYRVVTL